MIGLIKSLRSEKWVYILLFITALISYGNTAWNEYGYDDILIQTPATEAGIKGIPEILFSAYRESKFYKLDYRPVVLVSFAVEQELWGSNPHAGHAVNVLLFAICLCLIYRLLARLFAGQFFSPLLCLLITMIYGVHPVHTEVVASLKSRDELFALLFGLLFLLGGINFLSRSTAKWKWAVISLFFYILAMLSKSAIFPVFFILVVISIYYRYLLNNRSAYVYFALGTVLTVLLLYLALHDVERDKQYYESPLDFVSDTGVVLGTALRILLFQIRLMLVPYPLSFYYGYNMFPLVPLNDPYALISLFLHLFLLIYGAWKFFHRKPEGLLIAGYFVSMILYSNIITKYTSMFSERALFLSSLWFIAWVCLEISARFKGGNQVLSRSRRLFLVIVTGLVLFLYSWRTIHRNFQWKNSMTLMAADIGHLQESVMANLMFANNLLYFEDTVEDTTGRALRHSEALQHFYKTLAMAPDYRFANYYLGLAYRDDFKNVDSSLKYFLKTYDLDSNFLDIGNIVAKLYFDKGDFGGSLPFYQRIYQEGKADSTVLFYFANSLFQTGNTNEFLQVNSELQQKFPRSQYSYLNYGAYYVAVGNIEKAVENFDKAISFGCDNPKLINDMINYYRSVGDSARMNYYRSLLR